MMETFSAGQFDIAVIGAGHAGIEAALAAAKKVQHRTTWCVFQPHTYSRTAALFDDFVKQLRRPDVLLLAEIFAAREKNTIGISSAALAEQKGWVCKICGYVYEGETLPADFICPLCKHGAEDFEKLPE